MSPTSTDTRRPKGFVKWRPRSETLALLGKVQSVFEMYDAHLPLTARQIFYRLVGAYAYPKEELAYNRLCEHLVRARRAEMIPFDNIRDDGTIARINDGFFGVDHYMASLQDSVANYRRHPQMGQPYNIEVWCEAAGMVPQLARVAGRYGATVYSTGGFSSVTVTHETARRIVSDADRPTVFIHIGDHDPSGVSIYQSMAEDIEKFVYQLLATNNPAYDLEYDPPWFIYERAALTEDQIEAYDLPTAPPKGSDSRTENWVGSTCQAEALPPDILAKELTEVIERYYVGTIAEEVKRRGDEDQKELTSMVGKIWPPRTGWRE
jgi:hypothetical protein